MQTHRFAGLSALALLAVVLPGGPAVAQAFEPGPGFIVPGASMSGARIDGAPPLPRTRRIPGAPIFGDTAAERFYGRAFDNSYLSPRVPVERPDASNEARATQGRADANPINAGEFARGGPRAIGGSAVTRGSRFSPGGRAAIRR